MKKPISQALREEVLIFDGAMGTEIYKRHVFVNVCFDNLCITNPDLVKEIHQSYYNAGADVLITNSFGANREKLREFGFANEIHNINRTAAKIAAEVANSDENRTCYVAGDIGPFQWQHHSDSEIIEELKNQANALLEGGADFIIFESLSSRRAIELAVNAMQEIKTQYILSISLNSDFLSSNDETIEGLMAPLPNASNLAGWGLNCSTGPESMLNALEKVLKFTDLPVVVQPNAGMPRKVAGRNLYMSSPEYLCTYAMRYINLGAKGVGGCCGTSPTHIQEMTSSIKPFYKNHFSVESITPAAPEKTPTPLEQRSKLGKKLANGEWITSIEITPPRGPNLTDILAKAKICKEANIDMINIPDGPRASSRISALVTAIRILDQVGIEPFLHVCARDRNLIALQSDLLGCSAAGINNLLFITGDPPKLGNYPFATAVFDADAIGICKIQQRLNCGLDIGGMELPEPTSTVIGIGADPNAIDLQRELSRFRDKVQAGAEVVITQPVFNSDALKRFVDKIDADYQIPIIAGVWPLASYRNAVFMQNEVPGVSVPNWIMEKMAKYESKEDQRKMGIEIARQSLNEIRSLLAGVQVSAPFGNVYTALDVL